jgi:hypothetical protein
VRPLSDPVGDVALDGLAAVGRGASGEGALDGLAVAGDGSERDGSSVDRMKKRVAAAASSRRRTVSARARNFIVRRRKGVGEQLAGCDYFILQNYL